jgi:hypothetical protein
VSQLRQELAARGILSLLAEVAERSELALELARLTNPLRDVADVLARSAFTPSQFSAGES